MLKCAGLRRVATPRAAGAPQPIVALAGHGEAPTFGRNLADRNLDTSTAKPRAVDTGGEKVIGHVGTVGPDG